MSEVLRLTRTFDAPREAVFAAWTQPEQLTRWWGPGEFVTTTAEVDLRPGGTYRFVIEGPGAPVMELRGEFRTVEPPQRLVYTWKWTQGWMDPSDMLVTVEFHDRDGATELVLTQHGFVAEHGAEPYRMGWESGLDKLGAYLATRPAR